MSHEPDAFVFSLARKLNAFFMGRLSIATSKTIRIVPMGNNELFNAPQTIVYLVLEVIARVLQFRW